LDASELTKALLLCNSPSLTNILLKELASKKEMMRIKLSGANVKAIVEVFGQGKKGISIGWCWLAILSIGRCWQVVFLIGRCWQVIFIIGRCWQVILVIDLTNEGSSSDDKEH